jgi:diacylglycerol kinase (ATP)
VIPILPEYRNIAIIINPRARRGMAYRQVRKRLETVLRDLRIEAEWWETQGPGHATELAHRLRSEPIDMLLVAGGDGTVNEVVNGWVGHTVPLGVLPIGTSNILARVYGIRGSLEAACLRTFYGQPRPIPVGQANGRYFVLMAGVGLDGEVVAVTTYEQKFRWNRLAYAWHALRLALRPCPYEIRVYPLEGEGLLMRATQVIVTLVPNYGGFFRIVPPRWLAEHPMWVVGFQRNRWWNYMKYCLLAVPGWHVRLPDVVTLRVSEGLCIESAPTPIPVQVDGEAVGWTPVQVRLTGYSVRLVTPAF